MYEEGCKDLFDTESCKNEPQILQIVRNQPIYIPYIHYSIIQWILASSHTEQIRCKRIFAYAISSIQISFR